MSTATPIRPGAHSPRAQAAAEVRAWLARGRVSVNRLGKLTGKGQMYWYRRLSSEETPLDVEDFAMVAEALHIDLADVYRSMANGPHLRRSEDEGHNARPKGLEPPTFWLGASIGPEELADVVDLASRRTSAAPAGWESESLAPVLDLTARLAARGMTTTTALVAAGDR